VIFQQQQKSGSAVQGAAADRVYQDVIGAGGLRSPPETSGNRPELPARQRRWIVEAALLLHPDGQQARRFAANGSITNVVFSIG
jgi:hypothetical protein